MHNKISEMQTAGKKQRSPMDNIVVVSTITEQRIIEKRNILCRCSKVLFWLEPIISKIKLTMTSHSYKECIIF